MPMLRNNLDHTLAKLFELTGKGQHNKISHISKLQLVVYDHTRLYVIAK